MRDVLPTLIEWVAQGIRFATATVTQTWGSSPRPVGAVMGIRADGVVCGSVSAGCVESAVIEEALVSLTDGQPKDLVFGALEDSKYWELGLSCGGKIHVRITPEPNKGLVWARIEQNIEADIPFVVVTDYASGSQTLWVPGSPAPFPEVEVAYRSRRSTEVEVAGDRHFVHVLPRKLRLVIVGSVHIAVSLVRFAQTLGFETLVIDPRPPFMSPERFPVLPDRMIAEWPEAALAHLNLNEDTFAVVLTHDPKIDDVALAILLNSKVGYIGALGSRSTQDTRRATLAEQGFSEENLSRIHGPIGLSIGAKSPEEIALSIIAQIVQVKNARG